VDAVNTISSVGNAVGGAVGSALSSVGLASGGIVTQPTYALVGEAGPEAVIPLNENFGDALSDLTGGTAAGGSAGGGAENITIQVTSTPQISIASLSNNASLQELLAVLTQAVNTGSAASLVTAFRQAFAETKRRRS
jgi:SLT domain-containing protein